MNGSFSQKRFVIFTIVIAVCLSISLIPAWDKAYLQQQEKLSLELILRALSNEDYSAKEKNDLTITAVKKRGVDFSLTGQNEKLLRDAGANNELINAIREVSSKATIIPKSKTDFTNLIGMEFIKIPKGSFMMGSPESEEGRKSDEDPQREVTIDYEFYIGKYEVTQEEYDKVMGKNTSNFSNCPRCPVENISWNDAKEFIIKLNEKDRNYKYRLPTEAEWEYAARAGKATPFGVGDGSNLSSNEANFDGKYPYGNAAKDKHLAKTTEVGIYPPNGWGIYDMHGNVWEYVEDIYQENYIDLPTDGSANLVWGDSRKRIRRGGSWDSSSGYLRSAGREKGPLNEGSRENGFRIVANFSK